jgi:hypothetical protein
MFEVVERLHADLGPGRARLLILEVVELNCDELDGAPPGQRPAVLDDLTRRRALTGAG